MDEFQTVLSQFGDYLSLMPGGMTGGIGAILGLVLLLYSQRSFKGMRRTALTALVAAPVGVLSLMHGIDSGTLPDSKALQVGAWVALGFVALESFFALCIPGFYMAAGKVAKTTAQRKDIFQMKYLTLISGVLAAAAMTVWLTGPEIFTELGCGENLATSASVITTIVGLVAGALYAFMTLCRLWIMNPESHKEDDVEFSKLVKGQLQ